MPGGGVVRVPVSWLGEHAELPPSLGARELAEALVRVGLEVERVESAGDAITGPLVVGRVLELAEEPQKNGKTIRWCTVDVGSGEPHGIVCGASNFEKDDLVVVALPGAVLPGGFAIAARKTYGHVSDGMICSVRELGIGDDHAGILVLPPTSSEPGDEARDVLGLSESVLTISVTPDRGYCLSMRGLGREAASALGVAFHDVASTVVLPPADGGAYPVRVEDEAGCDQFSARAVAGLDPSAASPDWMRTRLRQAGMRPISLAVDVTNYVMLETGQPLHAFDRAKLSGDIVVRRAAGGEQLLTLDGAVRVLHPDDLLVTDASGPIALAGVMGGASTEISPATTEVVLEAAHWTPSAIAGAVRQHRLPSEAAKRFERGTDPAVAGVALQRCVDLLVAHGGARVVDGYTVTGAGPAAVTITMPVTRPVELAGMPISAQTVRAHLETVGCVVSGADVLTVTAPSWRPDLTMPADLVEEVVRIEGYDTVPSSLPLPPPGRGLTADQQFRRAVSRGLAEAGYLEVLGSPFVAPSVHDAFGLTADDPRRSAPVLANPLSDAEPELRTSLLPGLLTDLVRNVGRGSRDVALYEIGLVFGAVHGLPDVPRPGVDGPPSAPELAALDASIPRQPRHAAVVLAGDFGRAGWWGAGRPAAWADAVDAARTVARIARADLVVRNGALAPWHPGRCAELVLNGEVVGHAGELHPRVVTALDLPARACAMELDLSAFSPPPPALAPTLSPFPPVLLDVALVVPSAVSSAAVEAALRDGAGELLESVRLFDVYDRLGPDVRSLAFALRFRAPDRTLTVEEATRARDAAVAIAADRTGASLRG